MSESTSPPEVAQGDTKPPGGAPSDADLSQEGDPEADPDAEAADFGDFDDFGLSSEVRRALDDMGYEKPMEVQTAVFNAVSEGRDVQVESRTGSGKTAAFGIPLVEMIHRRGRSGTAALALTPTRELAKQVADELVRLAAHTDVGVTAVYGGAAMGPQIEALEDGVDVVIGTPGRVLDHIRRRNLRTDGIKTLILDECDEMLSMGFAEEIDAIIDKLPAKGERQTLLFSATIPQDIERIAKRHLVDPVALSLSGDHIAAAEIDHYYYVVTGMARTRDLLRVILTENPESALIFCNTRDDTGVVARYLAKNGFDAEAISGDLSQREREKVMAQMRAGNLRFLVATDVAARGIDISDLTHVINYQFPESPAVYVHRTGRTGRAGKTGTALSLVGARELGSFYYLKLTYQIRPIERDLPPSEELDKMLENHQYDRVTKLVTETPNPKFVSLAKRLLESEDGERIVGALLERLLVRETSVDRDRSEKEQAEEEREERRPRRARPGGGREGGRDRDGEGRGRRRRTRSRDDEERPARSREAAPAEASEADEEGTVRAEPQGTVRAEPQGEARAERPAGEDGEKPRRRRRRRRRRGERDEGQPSASAGDSDSDKEFWETWAEDKQSQDDESSAEDQDESDSLIRLYVNIGKREEVTVDEVRELISGFAGDEADQVGAIAVRNTHCFIRVPEELVEPIIEASKGQSFKDRELVIERARR
jgi:ATP-dependent RNA helicase DeaD